MPKVYAGIGSRETPDLMLEAMAETALFLSQCGYMLRSGGAFGADSAFASQADMMEIFIPWDTYNGHTVAAGAHLVTDNAIHFAASFHPAWHRCSSGAKKLHGRNAQIILGKNLDDPVEFVFCWTPDGKDSGGTGLGIRIAQACGIPVYNLRNQDEWPIMDARMKEIAHAAGHS